MSEPTETAPTTSSARIESRRYGPAITMVAALLLAAVLLILLPFNLFGQWNAPHDPWERVSKSLLAISPGFTSGPGPQVRPEDLILLESDPERGIYFYAAESQSGELIAGLEAPSTSGYATAPVGEDTIAAGFGGQPEEPAFYFTVERNPHAENGYRHELIEFADDAEMSDYMDALDR